MQSVMQEELWIRQVWNGMLNSSHPDAPGDASYTPVRITYYAREQEYRDFW